jgi:hypothetical protein
MRRYMGNLSSIAIMDHHTPSLNFPNNDSMGLPSGFLYQFAIFQPI